MRRPRTCRVLLAALLLSAASVSPVSAELAPRIVNGVLTWDPPAVGGLMCVSDRESCEDHTLAPVPGPPIGQCTGTLIGCRTFLTAAHCVCEGGAFYCNDFAPRDPSRYAVFLQHAGLFLVESVAVHPDYTIGQGWPNDVAVVGLVEPVEGIRPEVLNRAGTPPLGTPGTQVGFGVVEYPPPAPSGGVKRAGDVVTVDCSLQWPNAGPGHVCTDFEEPIGPPGEDSAPCPGDSGGPIFVDLGSGPVVASVHSGRTQQAGEPPDAIACGPPRGFINQDVFSVLDFIEAHAGSDLGTFCGDFPAVGDASTLSLGLAGTVSPSKPEERHEIDVPVGASLLRVTLNATGSNAGADFDVYAKAGAPAEIDDFDCAVAGLAQFGSCEVASPMAGPWHVLVTQLEGEGPYQVTAVAVPEPAHGWLLGTGALVLLWVRRSRTGARRRI